jgi:methionyl-tRNA synthetase
MAKDILRFHCVFWPALLLAAGYPVPRQIFVHGYLLLDDRKISKSLGNAIDPLDLVDVYGPDPVSFWAARAVSFGQDGSASLADIHERYERELGNDLGNLLSRTTAMIARYSGGRLEGPGRSSEIADAIRSMHETVPADFDRWNVTAAADRIWELVRRLNRYVEETQPWQIAKDDARSDELAGVLYDLADGLRAVAIALSPYLPATAPRILEALGQPDDLAWELAQPGRTAAADGIQPAQPLFPRIEAAPAAA